MSEQFTDDQLSFLTSSLGSLTLTCMCEANHGEGMCGAEAAVTVKLHIPHICCHPELMKNRKVDQFGCAAQILCVRCYWEARHFVEGKLAQTRAVTQLMSSVCQSCGLSLRVRHVGQVIVLDSCPRCFTDRIKFDAVCGAVRDPQGASTGCGKTLDTYSDIIVDEQWMVPQQQKG